MKNKMQTRTWVPVADKGERRDSSLRRRFREEDFGFHAGEKQLKDAEGTRCEDDKTGCNQIEENIQKEIIVGLR